MDEKKFVREHENELEQKKKLSFKARGDGEEI